MSKTIELCKVRPGETFALDGVDFVKLADDQGAVFALTADVILENVSFEKEGADRKDHNNFRGSNLEKVMERWVRGKHHAIYDALVERQIDLTTMDGMTDYGCPLATVRALIIDEYRKSRKFIPLTSEAYWLASGYSTKSSPDSNTNYAYSVNSDGMLCNDYVYNASFATRPALYLIPSVLVTVEDSDKKNGLADYTDVEMIEELYRRRKPEEETI